MKLTITIIKEQIPMVEAVVGTKLVTSYIYDVATVTYSVDELVIRLYSIQNDYTYDIVVIPLSRIHSLKVSE